MDKYNPDGKCIKCGSGDIDSGYQEERSQVTDTLLGNSCPESIVRTCKNCGFTWDEATLDNVEATSFRASDICQPEDMHTYDPPPTEIEVGDTVRARCSVFSTIPECKVLKMGTSQARLGKCEGICCCSNQYVREIVLIRKGPSKPIEIDMGQAEISNQGRYWQGPLPPKGTPDGRYNVTLRPIGEDSQ